MLLAHEGGATSIVDCSYASRLPRENFPETLLEVEGSEGSLRLDAGYRLTICAPRAYRELDVAPPLPALGRAAVAQHPGERARHPAALRRLPAAGAGAGDLGRRQPQDARARLCRLRVRGGRRPHHRAWRSTRDERARRRPWSSSTAPRFRRPWRASARRARSRRGSRREPPLSRLRRHRGPARRRLRGARPGLGHLRPGDRGPRDRPSGRTPSWSPIAPPAAARPPPCATARRSRATPTARLRFEAEAVPEGDFETNRCGFVVLHPARRPAAPATVEHCDGSRDGDRLPRSHRPLAAVPLDPRDHATGPAGASRSTCRLEGDEFEMEDQRNWSDASFKTYGRPLELPWPFALPSGVPVGSRSAVCRALPVPAAVGDAAGRRGVARRALRPERASRRSGSSSRPAEVAGGDRAASIGSPRSGRSGILCAYDPTAGDGAGRVRRPLRALQSAYPAAYDLECVVVGERRSRRGAVAGVAAAARRSGPEPRLGGRLPGGRPPVDAAGERLAGLPAARGRSTRPRGAPSRTCRSGAACSATSPS